MKKLSLIGLLVGLFAVAPLFGQEKSGSVTGVVSDDTGAVLPGVTITMTNKTTYRIVSAVTGFDGAYYSRNLDPGRYSVKFQLRGFSPTEYPDILVLVGQNVKLDIQLKVGGGDTVVEVTDTV